MPYRLIPSTADLVACGEALTGVPLFRPDDAPIDAVPSLWAVGCVRDRGYSMRTVWTYAESLRLFLDSQRAAAPGEGWERATKDDVIRFKREMAGRGNDADTISLRLAAVDNFFSWAAAHGFVRARPFRLASRFANSSPTLADDAVPVIGTPASTKKRHIVITADAFRRIRIENPIKDVHLRKRADLMFRWGWGTGLREGEVVGLSIRNFGRALNDELPSDQRKRLAKADFLTRLQATQADVFVLDLVPSTTKGSRGGAVMVPRELVKATAEWVAGGRAEISAEPSSEDCVFLTEDGRRVAADTLGRYFAESVARAGMEGSFHCLRHSYATRVLSEFHRLGHPALGELFVQKQLRHAARETTAIYTHAVHMEHHAGAIHMAVNRAFG